MNRQLLKFIFIISILGFAAEVSNAQPFPNIVPVPIPMFPPPVDSASLGFQGAYQAGQPNSPATSIALRGITSAISQLNVRPITAGVSSGGEIIGKNVSPTEQQGSAWFRAPSALGFYQFVNTDDHREFGADGDTQSGSVGFGFTTVFDLAVGVIYSYSSQWLYSSLLSSSTNIDSNFVSLYVAKSFGQYLYAGVVGEYGHTNVAARINAPPASSANLDSDTWGVTPFVGARYARGPFSGSFTCSYAYTTVNIHAPGPITTGQTGEVILSADASYAVTERLTVAAAGRFTKVVSFEDALPNFPQTYHWWTVGGCISYRVIEPLQLYVAYDAQINSYFDIQTVTAGFKYFF